ncbi:MAG: hypothetical protein ACKVOH_04385 [Chlamydiales bacterium]
MAYYFHRVEKAPNWTPSEEADAPEAECEGISGEPMQLSDLTLDRYHSITFCATIIIACLGLLFLTIGTAKLVLHAPKVGAPLFALGCAIEIFAGYRARAKEDKRFTVVASLVSSETTVSHELIQIPQADTPPVDLIPVAEHKVLVQQTPFWTRVTLGGIIFVMDPSPQSIKYSRIPEFTNVLLLSHMGAYDINATPRLLHCGVCPVVYMGLQRPMQPYPVYASHCYQRIIIPTNHDNQRVEVVPIHSGFDQESCGFALRLIDAHNRPVYTVYMPSIATCWGRSGDHLFSDSFTIAKHHLGKIDVLILPPGIKERHLEHIAYTCKELLQPNRVLIPTTEHAPDAEDVHCHDFAKAAGKKVRFSQHGLDCFTVYADKSWDSHP